jgi:hypothetical protein
MRNEKGQFVKGHKLSPESLEKMRQAHIGAKHSVDSRAKMSASRTGHVVSQETREKLSSKLAGRVLSEEWRKKISKSRVGILDFDKHYNWKGENAGYGSKHKWVRRVLGVPSLCENCDTTEAKRFEWANLSGEYKRDISDWARLCTSCHRLIDGHARKMWVTKRAKNV